MPGRHASYCRGGTAVGRTPSHLRRPQLPGMRAEHSPSAVRARVRVCVRGHPQKKASRMLSSRIPASRQALGRYHDTAELVEQLGGSRSLAAQWNSGIVRDDASGRFDTSAWSILGTAPGEFRRIQGPVVFFRAASEDTSYATFLKACAAHCAAALTPCTTDCSISRFTMSTDAHATPTVSPGRIVAITCELLSALLTISLHLCREHLLKVTSRHASCLM